MGALGVPVVGPRSLIARRRWGFHNVDLSSYVPRAYQALAIDEKRTPFLPAPWKVPNPTTEDERSRRAAQDVEQVWFSGCHSDIGGRRGAIAFAWMVEKARASGLDFEPAILNQYSPAADATQRVHESLSWWYKRYAGGVIRPVGEARFISQVVDPSADRKWIQESDYRPENLEAWRNGQPMQAPRPLKFRFMIKRFQDYFLRQYAQL